MARASGLRHVSCDACRTSGPAAPLSPPGPHRWCGHDGRCDISQIEPAAGLRSVDRNNEGYSTTYTTRLDVSVVCRGFIPAHGQIARRRLETGRFRPAPVAGPLRFETRGPIRIRLRCAGRASSRSGMDSDLEAFSHNPADGSVAALPGQTAAKTNYLNQRFLSY